jgi:hypothetical protein
LFTERLEVDGLEENSGVDSVFNFKLKEVLVLENPHSVSVLENVFRLELVFLAELFDVSASRSGGCDVAGMLLLDSIHLDVKERRLVIDCYVDA